MRSFEAPRARPTLGNELKLAAASFAILFGTATTGCERINRATEAPDLPQTTLDRIQREGEARPAEGVLALALRPSPEQPTEPSVSFSTLRIAGTWQDTSSNAGRFNDLVASSYRINVSSGAPTQVDRVIVPSLPADPGQLVHRALRLSYDYRRVQVIDRNRIASDPNRTTSLISQEVVARATDERQREVEITQNIPQISYTANSYATALGQILYTFALPPGNDVDVLMHQNEGEALRDGLPFRGENCGSITSAGMSNSIYCMRGVHRESEVVIDQITQSTDEHGLVTVKVFYRKAPTLPATPGR